MTSIIGTFSFPVEKKVIMDEFTKIANREGKNQSRLLVELVEQYVKSHSNGNPAFTLDQFQDPGFQAIPTLLSKPETWYKYLQECTEKERLDIQIKTKHINDQCKNIT